jgi:hypothetical protein
MAGIREKSMRADLNPDLGVRISEQEGIMIDVSPPIVFSAGKAVEWAECAGKAVREGLTECEILVHPLYPEGRLYTKDGEKTQRATEEFNVGYDDYLGYKKRVGEHVGGGNKPLIVLAEEGQEEKTRQWLAGIPSKRSILLLKTDESNINLSETLPWDDGIINPALKREYDGLRAVTGEGAAESWLRLYGLLSGAGVKSANGFGCLSSSGDKAGLAYAVRKQGGYCVESTIGKLQSIGQRFSGYAPEIIVDYDSSLCFPGRPKF